MIFRIGPEGLVMGRLLGILLIVLGIWMALEIYNEGTRNAFGGAFAFLGESAGDEDRGLHSAPRRAGEAARSS